MKKQINLLLTGAGRRVPIIKAFKKALTATQEIKGKLICVDMNPLSAGLYVADRYYIVPGADHPEYVPTLLDICRKEQVYALIPTTDEELLVISREKNRFSETNIQTVVSSYETVLTCSDKLATYKFLARHNIPHPRTYLPEDLPAAGDLQLPLFIKPRSGKGSINSFRINKNFELRYYLKTVPQPIIQEFIHGREYTVDVFCDLSGQVITAVPRERLATSAGVSQKGRTERNPVLEALAVEICTKLKIIGPANVQFIIDSSGPKCIEINPRLSGGIPLTLAAGANFPAMLLDTLQNKKIKPAFGRFEPDLVMVRYDESIFLRKGPNGYECCDNL